MNKIKKRIDIAGGRAGDQRDDEKPEAHQAASQAQQAFLYDLLGSLDRRRAAVDARCAVVFAVSGAALGLFMTQLKAGEPFYHGHVLWRVCFTVTILILLIAASVLGLNLIAPISRPRKVRKQEQGLRALSWFYIIAEHGEDDYCTYVKKQSPENLLRETAAQVCKISALLRKRYLRLYTTCRILYSGLVVAGLYIITCIYLEAIK